MLRKINKWIRRVKHYFSKQCCYDDLEYVKRDTKCDKCEFQNQCVLIDCTTMNDTRRHYISSIGNVCKKWGIPSEN